MKLLKIVSVFVTVFLGQSTVFGIICFQCNSNNNSDCFDLANYGKTRFYITPDACEPSDLGPAFCRKTVLKVIDKNKLPQERVIRSCGYIKSRRECYKTDNEGHQETVCQCFEDSCNSAESFTFARTSEMVAKLLLGMLAFLINYSR